MFGEWFVAGNIRLDLAALNKVETLLWDIWGTEPDSDEKMTDAIRTRGYRTKRQRSSPDVTGFSGLRT